MHYYSFNIADYKKDTAHLTPMEHYIYRALIDLYYLDEKPIPIKTHSVMRRLSLDIAEHEKMLLDVLNDFFEEREDGFYHKRIESEIEKYQANAEKNRKNGKKGGRPPKKEPKKTQSVSDGLPLESGLNPNQEPITNNQEPFISSNTADEYSVLDSISDWKEPELTEINAMLMMGSPPVPALTDSQYQYHSDKFKNYYAEKEIEGSYIHTEGRRKDMLSDWIKRDYQRNKAKYQGNNNANSQSHSSQPKQSQADSYAANLDAQLAAERAAREREYS